MIKSDLNKPYFYNDLSLSDDSIEETQSEDLMDYQSDELFSSMKINMGEELEEKIDDYEDFTLDLIDDVRFYTKMVKLLLEKNEDLNNKIDIIIKQKNELDKEIRMHFESILNREELEEVSRNSSYKDYSED